MKDKILNKIKYDILKKENEYGVIYPVSLYQEFAPKYQISFMRYIKNLTWLILALLVLLVILFNSGNAILGSTLAIIGFIGVIYLVFKKIKNIFRPTSKRSRPYEPTLKNFIYKNKLYSTFPNDELETEIKMFYIDDKDVFSVIIEKDGGRYQEVSDKLSDKLESALKMIYHSKKVTPEYVQYLFRKNPVERYVINEIPLESEDLTLRIYDNNSISLKANYNTLISGSSGSGKSFLTYGLIADFVSKFVIRNGKKYHSKLYILDGKMSDIYKFALSSGMSKNQYGSTVSDAFKIIREYTEELERRKNIYTNMDEYDKVLLDLNYEPYLLVIDEYPSLVAQMDNKQLKDWEKLLGNIARLGRQLSMGLFIVMQQAGAGDNGLPTAIREQLINKIFMGNSEKISQQSSEMVFATSKKNLPSPLHEIGEGIISIDGKEPTAFLSPMFTRDVDEIVMPVLNHVAKTYKEIEKETYDWEEFL